MPVDSIRGDRLIPPPPDSLIGDTISRDNCIRGGAHIHCDGNIVVTVKKSFAHSSSA